MSKTTRRWDDVVSFCGPLDCMPVPFLGADSKETDLLRLGYRRARTGRSLGLPCRTYRRDATEDGTDG